MGVLFENKVIEDYNNNFLCILTEISQNKIEILDESVDDIKNKIKSFISRIYEMIKNAYKKFKIKVLSFFRGNNKISKEKKEEFVKIVKKNKEEISGKDEKRNINISFRYPRIDITHNLLIGDIFIFSVLAHKERDLDKFEEEINNGEFFQELIKSIGLPDNSHNSFEEDLMDKLFYPSEDIDINKLDNDIVDEVKTTLDDTKLLKIIDEIENDNRKIFKELYTKYENTKNGRSKIIFDGVKIIAKFITMVNNHYVKLINFHINQCKKVFDIVISTQ